MIAYCDVVLDTTCESMRSGENALGNLFADVMRQYAETDIALLHGGYVRSNSVHSPGFVTLNTIQKFLEFEDLAVVVELTGEQIHQALENGVSRVQSNDGRFLHPSGLTYYFNSDDAAGYRVSNIQIKRNIEGEIMPVLETVRPDATYTCVLPSYIAKGGDGFSVFKSIPWKLPASACRKIKFIILDYLQSRIQSVMAQADLTMEDFNSIDNKVEDRIVRVRSHTGAYEDEGRDDGSVGGDDDGTVQTSTAVCQDDDGDDSVVGESVAPDGAGGNAEAGEE